MNRPARQRCRGRQSGRPRWSSPSAPCFVARPQRYRPSRLPLHRTGQIARVRKHDGGPPSASLAAWCDVLRSRRLPAKLPSDVMAATDVVGVAITEAGHQCWMAKLTADVQVIEGVGLDRADVD